MFGVDEDSFIEWQLLNGSSSAYAGEQGGAWSNLNARVHQEVEVRGCAQAESARAMIARKHRVDSCLAARVQVEGKELGITVTVDKPAPGFLPFTKTMEQLVLTAVYKPFALQVQRTGEPGASRRQVSMVQVRLRSVSSTARSQQQAMFAARPSAHADSMTVLDACAGVATAHHRSWSMRRGKLVRR